MIRFNAAIAAYTIFASLQVHALETRIDPSAFDLDNTNDYSFEERNLIRRAMKSGKYEEVIARGILIQLNEFDLQNGTNAMPLEKLVVPAAAEDCHDLKRVYVRQSVQNFPLLTCDTESKAKGALSEGAAFSIIKDREADQTNISIDGALGITLIPPRAEAVFPDVGDLRFFLVDRALMAFAEIDYENSDKDVGRFGINARLMFEGGPFERLLTNVNTYYQTDFNAVQQGYGTQISVFPQQSDWFLNAAVVNPDSHWRFVGIAGASADVFRIDEAGTSQLVNNQNYAWLGGQIGFQLQSDQILNGVTFTPTVEHYWDAVNFENATLFKAGLNFNLDAKGAATLGFGYSRGESRKTLVFEDQFTAELKLKLGY